MAIMQIAGAVPDETITTTDPGLSSARSLTTDSYPVQMWMGGQLINHGKVVEYEGDRLIVDPSAMVEGQLYPILLYGEKVWVTKEADGEVIFYHLER